MLFSQPCHICVAPAQSCFIKPRDCSSTMPGGIFSLPPAIFVISLDNECVTSSMLMFSQIERICQNDYFTGSLVIFFDMGLLSFYSTLVRIDVFGLIVNLITLIWHAFFHVPLLYLIFLYLVNGESEDCSSIWNLLLIFTITTPFSP